jgi:ATP synthase protein I
MRKAEHERPTLLAQTTYVGTLGLMFVLPVIFGVYLGHWLDNRSPGYSMFWTLSLLLVGVGVGAMNMYLMIRSKE